MSLFTIHSENKIDQDIQSDLDHIVSAINSFGTVYDAIYLIGSFGHGEGAVIFNGERWQGVNDYDLLIISSDCEKMRACCKGLSGTLARCLQIDFVDFMCLDRNSLSELAPTMQNYDFKYGSLLIAGQDVLHEVPDFVPGDIPPYEFVRLLCNRSAGLLTAKFSKHLKSQNYVANQFLKACIAVGDIAVYLSLSYHHSYRVRWKAFSSLFSSDSDRLPFKLPGAAIEAVNRAYDTKLKGPSTIPFFVDEQLMRLMIKKTYCAIAAHLTDKVIHSISSAETAIVNHYRKGNGFRQCIKQRISAYRYMNINHAIEISKLVLFSQPFFYYHFQSSRLKCSIEYIRRFNLVPGALNQNWSVHSAVKLWETHCH